MMEKQEIPVSGRAASGKQKDQNSQSLHHHFVKVLAAAGYGISGSVFLEATNPKNRPNVAESAISNLFKLSGPVCSNYHVLVVDCMHTARGDLNFEIARIHDDRASSLIRPSIVTQTDQKISQNNSEMDELCELFASLNVSENKPMSQSCIYQTCSTTFEILGMPSVLCLRNETNLISQVSCVLSGFGLSFEDIRIIVLAGVDLEGTVGDWALLRSMTKTSQRLTNGCPLLKNSVEWPQKSSKMKADLTDSVIFISAKLLQALECGFDGKIFADALGVSASAMWFFNSGFNHSCALSKPKQFTIPRDVLLLTNGEDISDTINHGAAVFVPHAKRAYVICDPITEVNDVIDDVIPVKRIRTQRLVEEVEEEEEEEEKKQDEDETPGFKRNNVISDAPQLSKRLRSRVNDVIEDAVAVTTASVTEIGVEALLAKRTLDILAEDMPRRIVHRRIDPLDDTASSNQSEESKDEENQSNNTNTRRRSRRKNCRVGRQHKRASPIAVAY